MTIPALVPSRLRQETFLEHIEIHPRLASTNDHALALAADPSIRCPALVAAEHQTAGRGRGGHRWQAGPGALTFSLLLDHLDRLPRERLPLVSLVTGMATREAIARTVSDSPVHVKWPNDVYLKGKKVAGILTETASAASGRLVVGIGINVNNSLADAPPVVQQRGIALADETGSCVDPTDLLIALLIELELEFARLADNPELDTIRWRSHCLLTDRKVTVRVGPLIHRGSCRGIASDGGLQIEQQDRIQTLHAGEVISW